MMNSSNHEQQYLTIHTRLREFLDIIKTFFRSQGDLSIVYQIYNWEFLEFKCWKDISSIQPSPVLVANMFYLMVQKYALHYFQNGLFHKFEEVNIYNDQIIKICDILSQGFILNCYNEVCASFLISHLMLMHEQIDQFKLWDELYDIVTGKQLQIIDYSDSDSLSSAMNIIRQLLQNFETYSNVIDILKLFSHENNSELYPSKMNQELNDELIALIPDNFLVHVFYDIYRHQYYRNIDAMIIPSLGIILNCRYISKYFNIINSAQLVILILQQLFRLREFQDYLNIQNISQQLQNLALADQNYTNHLNMKNSYLKIQDSFNKVNRNIIVNLPEQISQLINNPWWWTNENISQLRHHIQQL